MNAIGSIDTRPNEIVIVGCGIAGLSAAATALQAGARVTILERSIREDRGGNSRWGTALLRMKSEHEVSDDFAEHFANNSGYYLDPVLMGELSVANHPGRSAITRALGFTDPDMVALLVKQSGPSIQWLKTFGVKFDFFPTYYITASQPRLSPDGHGMAVVEALADWCEANGATVHYETTARRLLQDDDGRIAGVRAADKNGRSFDIRGDSTILACGGFEGNPEMLSQHMGPRSRFIRPVARGGYYNKGEGLRMAMDVGAAPCGDYSSFHAEPLDPRSGVKEPIVLVFNYGILVNRQARRFVDEAPSTPDQTYEGVTRTINEQPDGIAWVILDSRVEDVPDWRRSVWSDQPPHKADTLAELAVELGLDPAALKLTVDDYNAACPDEAGFEPLKLDGLHTAEAFTPKKSNWSKRVEKGPFLAFPIICGICFTFGGLKVDLTAKVLDTSGVVIPGLYAGGEMIGMYYGSYPGATSVLRAAVFGRIAGADAAQKNRVSHSIEAAA